MLIILSILVICSLLIGFTSAYHFQAISKCLIEDLKKIDSRCKELKSKQDNHDELWATQIVYNEQNDVNLQDLTARWVDRELKKSVPPVVKKKISKKVSKKKTPVRKKAKPTQGTKK